MYSGGATCLPVDGGLSKQAISKSNLRVGPLRKWQSSSHKNKFHDCYI